MTSKSLSISLPENYIGESDNSEDTYTVASEEEDKNEDAVDVGEVSEILQEDEEIKEILQMALSASTDETGTVDEEQLLHNFEILKDALLAEVEKSPYERSFKRNNSKFVERSWRHFLLFLRFLFGGDPEKIKKEKRKIH